jgi:hypothetical protein
MDHLFDFWLQNQVWRGYCEVESTPLSGVWLGDTDTREDVFGEKTRGPERTLDPKAGYFWGSLELLRPA